VSHDAPIACGIVIGADMYEVPVLEDLSVHREARRAISVWNGADQRSLHRGQRRDRLEGGARRIEALGDAIEPGVVRRLRRLGIEQRRELLAVRPPDEEARLVRRRGRHRQDLSVLRVHRDDRAAFRKPVIVLVRERDPVLERPLGSALQRDVDRQPDG
jgi:hypothetical protein